MATNRSTQIDHTHGARLTKVDHAETVSEFQYRNPRFRATIEAVIEAPSTGEAWTVRLADISEEGAGFFLDASLPTEVLLRLTGPIVATPVSPIACHVRRQSGSRYGVIFQFHSSERREAIANFLLQVSDDSR